MATRITTATELLRHNFTVEEMSHFGSELAQAHSQIEAIENEEAVVKAQFKERKAQVQQSIGKLSRNIIAGFEMSNVECEVRYDSPNVFEVSYYRKDTGELVRTRPMSESERQAEIPFDTPIAVNPEKTEEAVEASVEQSQEAVEEFFGKQDATATDQPMPMEEAISDDNGMEPITPEPVAVASNGNGRKRGAGRRPQGFDKPTNPSVDLDF